MAYFNASPIRLMQFCLILTALKESVDHRISAWPVRGNEPVHARFVSRFVRPAPNVRKANTRMPIGYSSRTMHKEKSHARVV